MSEADHAAFYSFQDEQLRFGVLRNRRTVLPTSLRELKPIEKYPVGRVLSTRWPGKQGIELDRSALRLPVTAVSDADFTLSAWIRQNGIGTIHGGNLDSAATLIALGDGLSNGWRLDLLSPSNRIVFQLYTPKDRQQAGTCGSLRIPPKTWIHIAISRAPNRIRLYINGLLAGERPHDSSPSPLKPTSSLKIGYIGNGFSSGLFQIDELCIWSTEISPYRILCNSLQLNYRNEKIERFVEEASASFARYDYYKALAIYQECMMEPTLPNQLEAALKFRCGELNGILGNLNESLKIFSELYNDEDVPLAIRSHSLHERLHIIEKHNHPSDSDLSAFSVATSLLYGDLAQASASYSNAMIEYDFLMPQR